jgi:hypothetical protein
MSDFIVFGLLAVAIVVGLLGALLRGPLFGRIGAVAAAGFAVFSLTTGSVGFYGVGVLFCLLFLALSESLSRRAGP